MRLTSSTRRQSSSRISRNGAPHGDAGVGDEHVDAAEQLVDARERALDLQLVGDVAEQRRLQSVDALVRRLDLQLADGERDDAAPSAMKRRLVASPMPLVPPVTTTRFPWSPFTGESMVFAW